MPWKYRKTLASVSHRVYLLGKAVRLVLRNRTVKHLILPRLYGPKLKGYQTRKPRRERPLFLVLRHKYFRGGVEFGDSNEEHVITSPLRSSGVADVEHYFYDLEGTGTVFNDRALVDRVLETQPDLIVLSSHNPDNVNHPQLEVLEAIRSQCQIPFAAMWADTTSDLAFAHCNRMSKVIDLNLLLDSNSLGERNPGKPEFLRLWTPLDFSVFHTDKEAKEIPVSFIGSTGDYRSGREDYLGYLKDQNLEVFREGSQESPVSLARYAEILRKSRISLNFSHAAYGTHQFKGRVLEVMFSGAMLMENKNSETTQFFTPSVDYVDFDSKEDLADKLRFYAEHEQERQEIALAGHQKAIEQYNYRTLWQKVMEKLKDLEILPEGQTQN